MKLTILRGEQELEFQIKRAQIENLPVYKVFSVSFSPDSQVIATASEKSVKLWSSDGVLRRTLPTHNDTVRGVSFSPDGKTLAVTSSDRTVKLWSLDGKELKTMKGYKYRIQDLSFSPDGKMLASIGAGEWSDIKIILWNLDLDDLVARSCDWMRGYLEYNPSAKSDHHLCDGIKPSAQLLVKQGRDLTRAGDIEGAVAKFREALKQNPSLSFEPEKEAHQLARSGQLVAEGEKLARTGDFKGAVAKFQEALKQDSSLSFLADKKARQLAAPAVPALIEQGEKLVKQGDVKKALEAYRNASEILSREPVPIWEKPSIPPSAYNTLCWYGSLHGYAKDVINNCDSAVGYDEHKKNQEYQDSRGLARALTGNTKGAIEDFQAYIIWLDNNLKKMPKEQQVRFSEIRARRQRWIEALRAGKNPFTPEEIKRLFNE